MKIYFILFAVLCAPFLGCKNSSYPCPGTGQYQASDMSLFDEDGKPIVKKKKKKKTSKKNDFGLINKTQPDNLKMKRKKSINDRPKI